MNIGKPNEDIIAVKTLLEAANFPKYEDIKDKGQIAQRIIEPFNKNLNALSDILSWEFCQAKGAALDDTDDQFIYKKFSKLNVHVFWKDYPDQARLIERRNKRIVQETKKRARKGRKSSRQQASLL